MSDEPENPRNLPATKSKNLDKPVEVYRDYSEEDKYSALARLDINGGNVYRTAQAYGIPYSTLRAWVKEREARGGGPSNLERERRGSLANKLEALAHDLVESIVPDVIRSASLSQRAVTLGIVVDKARALLGQGGGLDPDPRRELCRMLGINELEFPERLEIQPGSQIPAMFLLDDNLRPIIDIIPEPNEPAPETQPEPRQPFTDTELASTPEFQPQPSQAPEDDSRTMLDSLLDDDEPSN